VLKATRQRRDRGAAVRPPEYKAPYLYELWLEYGLNGELASSLEVLRLFGVQPPMAILVTVIGVNGYVMLAGENHLGQSGKRFDRDMLLLPDVVLDAPIRTTGTNCHG
jgi:hypothetical protein